MVSVCVRPWYTNPLLNKLQFQLEEEQTNPPLWEVLLCVGAFSLFVSPGTLLVGIVIIPFYT